MRLIVKKSVYYDYKIRDNKKIVYYFLFLLEFIIFIQKQIP